MSEAAAVNEKKPEISPVFSELYDWIEVLVLSITFVFLLFTFIMRVAIVNGPSMQETLHDNDVLIVRELFYKPQAGDVIVCQSPYMGYVEPLVKRIIATEGQTITIDFENWKVSVDGVELDEKDYVNFIEGAAMNGWSYGDSYTVPDGCVFVMGDNRNNSLDSRNYRIGAIDTRLIIGKALLRLMPLDGVGVIK